MPQESHDNALILGFLGQRGLVSSANLQAATGKSQATVSRLLIGLSDRVVSLGSARSTRYALPQPIRGFAAQQPIWWTDTDGRVLPIGLLSHLNGSLLHIDSEFIQPFVSDTLPWFLTPLRTQGFLGRLHAHRLAAAGLSGDPDQWDLESTLFAALHLHDAPGAISVGDTSRHTHLQRLPAEASTFIAALDAHAHDVASTLPAGSSAGGEQPKFLAALDSGEHVLVKFSPPHGTPYGERWRDLLHAECLALQVLADWGVSVAQARVVESSLRTFLISKRFDRLGAFGRRHVVSIGDAHKAFVAGPYSHWAATALALSRQGRLSSLDANRVAALLDFGRLTGNSDMHSGNFGLFVDLDDLSKGRFTLAPVYDMLPMRWRPNPALGGAPDYTPFELDARSAWGPAMAPARQFWLALEASRNVSAGLRTVAGQMVRRFDQLKNGSNQ